MAWTQDDVDAIKAALATGARDVQYSDGSRVSYRSEAEMMSIMKRMQTEVAGSSVTRVKTVRFGTSKGF
jgi:hypothetical protein